MKGSYVVTELETAALAVQSVRATVGQLQVSVSGDRTLLQLLECVEKLNRVVGVLVETERRRVRFL